MQKVESQKNKTALESLPKGWQDDLAFSKDKENILVVLFDGFVGPHVPKIFREYPEIKENFTGFTHYKNTITEGSGTLGSMMGVLHGKGNYSPAKYNKAQEYNSLGEAYDEAFAFIPNILKKEGYKTYYHNPNFIYKLKENKDLSYGYDWEYENYYKKEFGIKDVKHDPRYSALYKKTFELDLLNLMIFKISPPFLKALIYNNGKWVLGEKLYNSIKYYNTAINNLATLISFPKLANTNSKTETYKFFHFQNTHPNYSVNKNLETVLIDDKDYDFGGYPGAYYTDVQALKIFSNWIKWLKENGVYDNTKIILLSDHGFKNSSIMKDPAWIALENEKDKGFVANHPSVNPLLMLKDFNSNEEIKYEKKPMLLSDFPYLVTKNIPDQKEAYESIFGEDYRDRVYISTYKLGYSLERKIF